MIFRKLILLLFFSFLSGLLFSLPPLPDHLSFAPGYSRIVSSSLTDDFQQGFSVDFEYAQHLTSVEYEPVSYIIVPFKYCKYDDNKHFGSLGGGYRYWFSRINKASPFIQYSLTFDQIYGPKNYFGIGNTIAGGYSLQIKEAILFLQVAYHHAYFPGWFFTSAGNYQEVCVQAGIRFYVRNCDCSH
jgi:hypothetical protein